MPAPVGFVETRKRRRADGVLEDPFPQRLKELEAFLEEHGEYPKLNRGEREGEKELGKWIHNKRQRYKKGKVSKERIEALNALPGWKWEGHFERAENRWEKAAATFKANRKNTLIAFVAEEAFVENLDKLRAFVDKHGAYPKKKGRRDGEAELGTWIANRRKQYKRGKLSEERVAALTAVPGWKWTGSWGAGDA